MGYVHEASRVFGTSLLFGTHWYSLEDPRGTRCFHLVSMLYPLIPKYSHLTPSPLLLYLGHLSHRSELKANRWDFRALGGLVCTPLTEGTELKITSALLGG